MAEFGYWKGPIGPPDRQITPADYRTDPNLPKCVHHGCSKPAHDLLDPADECAFHQMMRQRDNGEPIHR